MEFKIQEAVVFDSYPLSLSTLKISTVKKEMPKLGFFVIAGAFSDPKNAMKRIAQLKRSGFEKASYLGRNKYGLHQVSFQGFTTERAAREFLIEVKTQHTMDAWLLIIKN
ncbi:SPOR domain-containing protein [Flavobacteriaceae bacterium]|nr:SPOR domain-containing protein [Flavobacteriaceae bacterium]